MKLWVYSDLQLTQIVNQCLAPLHVRDFFYSAIHQNNLTLVEYFTGLFNLEYLPHYTRLTPGNTSIYEYESVVREFESTSSWFKSSDVHNIYGVDPLDAIYQHHSHSSGYDGFTGHFYEDLYSLMESVNPEECGDYLQDVSAMIRYVVDYIERQFVPRADTSDNVYVTISSKDNSLMFLVV